MAKGMLAGSFQRSYRVMDPIEVPISGAQRLGAGLIHRYHRIFRRRADALRHKPIRDEIAVSGYHAQEFTQNLLRSAYAVNMDGATPPS